MRKAVSNDQKWLKKIYISVVNCNLPERFAKQFITEISPLLNIPIIQTSYAGRSGVRSGTMTNIRRERLKKNIYLSLYHS